MSLPAHQQYYKTILTDPSIQSYTQPQNDYNIPQHLSRKAIFPLCDQQNTPQFFKSNLLSPNRIIKYLTGEYCVYRAFYFQLFKLMFEIENEQKDYLELFKEIIFDPEIIQRNGENSRAKRENSRVKTMGQTQNNDTSQVSQMSEQQAFRHEFRAHQKCITLFIQKVLQNQLNFTSFQQYLPYYPQVDQSMVLILQTFIQNAASSEEMDSIQTILEYLCEIFEIQLVVIDNCFKFQQSDVFLYIQQKEDEEEEVWVYIAFNQIVDDGSGEQQEEEEDGEQGKYEAGQAQHYQDDVRGRQNKQRYEHSSHNNNYHESRQYDGYQSPQSPHQYPNQTTHSRISSSSQNPSHIQDKSSSSIKDQVITSEIKPPSSNQKYFDQYNHPKVFGEDQGDQNRPSRISSEMGNSQTEKFQAGENLTKSNHLPNIQTGNNQNAPNKQPNSQLSGFNQPVRRQDLNFQKKVRYFDEDSIIESVNPSAKQLTKQQSHTQPYRQDVFHRRPDKDNGSLMPKTQNEVVQNNLSGRSVDKRRVSQSRAQTIINMFGDMLSSSSNLNTFDPMHGSSSSIGNAFVSSSHHKLHAEQDISNPYSKHLYTKNYLNAYGTSNHVIATQNVSSEGNSNNLNMKKTKSEHQIVFEAKPKNSNDLIGTTDTRENIVRNNGLSQQNNTKSHEMLMDSEQLRSNQNNAQQYYPFANINLSQQHPSNIPKQKQPSPSSQNSDRDNLDNIQARTVLRQENKSQTNRSNAGSFHSSSRGSTQSHQIGTEQPNIRVKSIKSESQTSSKELNKRNNYYQNEDFRYIGGQQLDRDTSIRSEEHQERNYNRKEQFINQKQQQRPLSGPKFSYQYRSQQVVHIPAMESPHLSKAYSRTYTSNNQSETNNNSKLNKTENTEEDDFFFHPSNKSSIKYGLKTIEEVRASRETYKQSYRNGEVSKISDRNRQENAEDKLGKYELVNSVEGITYSNNQGAKYQKPTTAINKLFDTNSYKLKETKHHNQQLNDSSVNNGTFYKQFTNSKVLKLLKQPYKTKVQILKNRFKGEHRAAISKNIIT